MIGKSSSSVLGSSWRGGLPYWLAFLNELDIPEDNSAWAKAAPKAKLPESSVPYSLMILPDFNEKEYMNQPIEEGAKEVPTDEAIEPAGEAAAEEVGEDGTQD